MLENSRLLRLLLRFRFALLGLFALSLFPTDYDVRQGDWHFFVQGSRLLAGHGAGGGLHVFASHPEMHMGPLCFVVAWALRAGGGSGLAPAEILMWALGPVTLVVLERAARAVRGGGADLRLQLTTLLGGAAFLKAWMFAAGIMAHLDDVLAVFFTAIAAWAVATRRPWLVGLAIGLAAAAKPWGIILLPLCLAVEPRGRARAALATVATTCAWWLPFVVADHATFSANSYSQANDPSSALRALGVTATEMPHWVRPTQVLVSLALGTFAVLRGRWPAAIAVALAARIALDPSVYGYYTPTLIIGALAWDLLGSRRALPIWTGVIYAGVVIAPWFVSQPSSLGDLRLAVSIGLVAGALVLPATTRARARALAV